MQQRREELKLGPQLRGTKLSWNACCGRSRPPTRRTTAANYSTGNSYRPLCRGDGGNLDLGAVFQGGADEGDGGRIGSKQRARYFEEVVLEIDVVQEDVQAGDVLKARVKAAKGRTQSMKRLSRLAGFIPME